MFASLLTTIVLAGHSFAPAPEPDPRWQAWLGCWQPADAAFQRQREPGSSYYACVIPTANPAAVEVVTVENGAVAGRETIQVTGSHQPSNRGGCSGWESAEWSPEQSRVYISSEQACEGGRVRKSSGVLSIGGSGDWLDVRALTSGGNTGVRVLRYRSVDIEGISDQLPAEIFASLRDRTEAIATARMAAGRRLRDDDVIEASQRLDAPVVEAWLIENHQGFGIDGHDLARLADAGVPGSVTDVMIALSYPKVFAIDDESRESGMRPSDREPPPDSYRDPGVISVWDPFGYSPFGYRGYPYGPLGYGAYGGYGWYAGSRPIIVVTDAPSTDEESDGQAVKGRGYRRHGGDGSGGSGSSNRPTSSNGGGSSDGGGSSAAAPASEGSSGSGRTAHPRN